MFLLLLGHLQAGIDDCCEFALDLRVFDQVGLLGLDLEVSVVAQLLDGVFVCDVDVLAQGKVVAVHA